MRRRAAGRSRATPAAAESAESAPGAGFLKPSVSLSYELIDLAAAQRAALPRPNPLSWIADVEQSAHARTLPERVRELGEWLAAAGEPGLTRSFDLWLGALGRKWGVKLPSIREYEEASAVLAEKIDRWGVEILEQGREEGREEGREQGREEGIERGLLESIREVLELRFGADAAIPLAARLEAAGGGVQRLRRLRREAIRASDLAAFQRLLETAD